MVGQLQAPVDYFAQLAPFDIGQDMRTHQLQTQQDAILQAQQQRAVQQQAQLEQARALFAKDPSAKNFSTLVTYDPKSYEAIKSAHDAMDTDERNNSIKEQTAIHGYLAAGRPKEAGALLDRRIAADKAAGLDTADDQEFRDLIDEDPAAAAATVAFHLGSAVGADKFGEVFGKVGDSARADAELPGKIANTTADTTGKLATANKTVAETGQVAPNAEAERRQKEAQAQRWSAQTAGEAEARQIDRDRLEADSAATLAKLDAAAGTMTPATEKIRNDAVLSATASSMEADGTSKLINDLSGYEGPTAGGLLNGLNKGWSIVSGQKSPVQQMRTRAAQFINSAAVASLPPGPASDRDIKVVREGFPKASDSREVLVEWLNALERTQRRAAQSEQIKADWVNSVGNLGNARNATLIGGTAVSKGERYADYRKRQIGEAGGGAAGFFSGGQK